MATIRRLYIYLVCAVALQVLGWDLILMLQTLLPPGPQGSIATIAMQCAVVIVGLPIFLAHWLWAQRLASRETEERGSTLRRLYLYSMLAVFLFGIIGETTDLVMALVWRALGSPGSFTGVVSAEETAVNALIALAILPVLWFYHQRIVAADARAIPETGNSAVVRRLYILVFAVFGLARAATAAIELLRWLMGLLISPSWGARQIAAFIVSVAVWVIFWTQAQRLFRGSEGEERESALRKAYLYLVVFIAILSAVSVATMLLQGALRGLLGLPVVGNLQEPLSVIIVAVVVWAYHALVLRDDATLADAGPRQRGVRRVYLYLMAGIGLAAFLGGLGGTISVIIRSLAGETFGPALKDQLAWFIAAIIAGLPVWLLPWRQLQTAAVATGTAGAEERQSVVRKVYLYLFLFVATMTALGSLVYIVAQFLRLILGDVALRYMLTDLGHAIAFSLIAGGVWLYHGMALRNDGKMAQQEKMARLATMHVAVLDTGEGRLGRAILDALQRELSGISLHPVGLTPAAAAIMGAAPDSASALAQLAQAGLIVTPWYITMPGEQAAPEIIQAITASPARRLLVPGELPGWEWLGVGRWSAEDLSRQAAQAVKRIAEGEQGKPARPMSTVALILIILFALLVLSLGVSLLLSLLFNGF